MTPHPMREALHNEVHARPYETLKAPLLLSHLAFVGAAEAAVREHFSALLRSHHLPPLAADANHLSVNLGGTQLRWEKHTEFQTWTFWRAVPQAPSSFDATALDALAPEWLAAMPGQWLVGLHMLVLPADVAPALINDLVHRELHDNSLVGSVLMGGAGEVRTDFRLHDDGYARFVLINRDMSPRRLGRAAQRLLEIETYRMGALLGLPMAREVGGALAQAEHDLAAIAGLVRTAQQADEPELLRRLTQLAAEVESLYARTHARFSASAAYFELVQRRIGELREERVEGLQTVGEFMDRRLAPAMQTCAWASRRQQAMSERLARTTGLLQARVEIEQEQSNQALLDAMNRRQKAQLLLQSAVEGLSVAAVTYYGAGLVGYAAKGAKAAGWNVQPDVLVAISIPVIALAVWRGIGRLHRVAQAAADQDDAGR